MTAIEIILIIIGFICLCVSCFVAKKNSSYAEGEKESLSSELWTEREEEKIKERVGEILSERQDELVDTTEERMNRLCNDKIMAVDEFSQQILEKIDANHQDVVFMYNLLGEKENELKELMTGKVTPEEDGDTFMPEEPVMEQEEEPDAELEKDALDEIFKEQWGASEEEPDREKINRKIKKMHEQGQSVLEISKALDMGQGEVKLVLDLYGGRK